MRPRYLLVAGGTDPTASDTLADRLRHLLPCRSRFDDLELFSSERTSVLPLTDVPGFVLGRLFERASGQPVHRIPRSWSLAIDSSAGRHLTEKAWGSYLAAWRTPRDGWRLLRDPSATVSAYMLRIGRTLVVTSDIDLLLEARLAQAAIDWRAIASILQRPIANHVPTALAGVSEIAPGMRVTVETMATEQLWAPATFLRHNCRPFDKDANRERLVMAIDETVRSLCTTIGKATLELSGGLDSSIVATALVRSGVDWSILTAFTSKADGDERIFAGQVASNSGKDLHTVRIDEARAVPTNAYSRLTPRPRGSASLVDVDRAMMIAADDLRADAVFSGAGGDNVFFSTQSTAPILSALVDDGVPAAHRTAIDMAKLVQVPLASVYWNTARRALSEWIGRPPPANRTYLTDVGQTAASTHPWLDVRWRVADGSRARIASLLQGLALLDGVDRMVTRTTLCPLLAQPVMEACLSIPSWAWVSGGRDRAFARTAFADRLPLPVVERQGKGRIDSLVVGAFDAQRAEVRSLLLDGLLARERLIDTAALARDLARPSSDRRPFQDRIFALIDTELWARALSSAIGSYPPLR